MRAGVYNEHDGVSISLDVGVERQRTFGSRIGRGAGRRNQTRRYCEMPGWGCPVRSRQRRRSLAGNGDGVPYLNRYQSNNHAKGNANETGSKNRLPGKGRAGRRRNRSQDRAGVVQARTRLGFNHYVPHAPGFFGTRGRAAINHTEIIVRYLRFLLALSSGMRGGGVADS